MQTEYVQSYLYACATNIIHVEPMFSNNGAVFMGGSPLQENTLAGQQVESRRVLAPGQSRVNASIYGIACRF